ncbi:MAG: hypothetical protein Q7S78_00745 [Candidatus Azambacteria bacterium]|nr:hypothetical protein [Candidatus Azambacteria bacterium]
MKITPKTFLFAMPFLVFFIASFIWLEILSQKLGFFAGLVILSLASFLVFWNGLLINRRAGELFGLKSRKQIFVFSLGIALGFCELIWAISFLPFPFFILGGMFTVIFAFAFNIIITEHSIMRNAVLAAGLIIIFILSSPWLPPKVF